MMVAVRSILGYVQSVFMIEEESSPELLSFYTLLEKAFPLTSIEVGFIESNEMYLNEIRARYFNGLDWRLTDFPAEENDGVEPAFDLLDNSSKIYYIAAYMRESIIDPYYRPGCLNYLKTFSRVPDGQFSRMDSYQRESVVWYCDFIEKEINTLPFMDRFGYAMEIFGNFVPLSRRF
jgi:hypothetical protein